MGLSAKQKNFSNDFSQLTDEELVERAQNGSDAAVEYLILKYSNYVRSKARSYFLVGADREDLIQEGMFGLYKAIRDYQPDRPASFRGFADLCITRQMITAVKTATRQKHLPLNSYVSLNKPVFDDESDRTLMDMLTSDSHSVADPELLTIDKESFDDISDKMSQMLSTLEWQVLIAYINGKSYQEIAEELERHVKSVDNALQRVKKKLERYIERRNNNWNRQKR